MLVDLLYSSAELPKEFQHQPSAGNGHITVCPLEYAWLFLLFLSGNWKHTSLEKLLVISILMYDIVMYVFIRHEVRQGF